MKNAVCQTFALLASFISALIPLRVLPAFECARGSSARGTETGQSAPYPPRRGFIHQRRGTRAEAGTDPEARTQAAAKIPENCYKMRKFLPEIFYMIPEIFYIHHRRFSTR